MKVAKAVAPADRASVRSASSRGRAGWRDKDARRWPPPYLRHRRRHMTGRSGPFGRSGSGRDREDRLDVVPPCGQSPQQFGFWPLKIEHCRRLLGRSGKIGWSWHGPRSPLSGPHGAGAILDHPPDLEEPLAGIVRLVQFTELL